jgi:hypothetical protein
MNIFFWINNEGRLCFLMNRDNAASLCIQCSSKCFPWFLLHQSRNTITFWNTNRHVPKDFTYFLPHSELMNRRRHIFWRYRFTSSASSFYSNSQILEVYTASFINIYTTSIQINLHICVSTVFMAVKLSTSKGRAMAQAVSRWLPTAAARVQTRV